MSKASIRSPTVGADGDTGCGAADGLEATATEATGAGMKARTTPRPIPPALLAGGKRWTARIEAAAAAVAELLSVLRCPKGKEAAPLSWAASGRRA
jgi:hypothetical protein